MRVVVTGATGFIGGHLCPALRTQGFEVVVVGRRRPDADVEYVACADLADCDLSAALRGADALVHLAGLAHERAVALDKENGDQAFLRVNVLATERLAREAAGAGIGQFVFVSTIQVCGEETHGVPFNESSALAPRSRYARSKVEAEQRLVRVANETGLRVTVFRPTLVYGPGNGGNMLRLLRLVQRGWPLPLGAVRNRRNLCFVGNLVSAISAALRSRDVQGLFVACDRSAFSTPDLVRSLAHAMGRKAMLLSVPPSLLRAAAAVLGQGDAARRLLGSLEADSSKLERELAWTPPFESDEALRLTARWFSGDR